MDQFLAELDIAFAKMQEAFFRLKSLQLRVDANRSAIAQYPVTSPRWTDSDREQNQLQQEWREAYRSFAQASRVVLRCVDRAEAGTNTGP